jgi:hypothetical protein
LHVQLSLFLCWTLHTSCFFPAFLISAFINWHFLVLHASPKTTINVLVAKYAMVVLCADQLLLYHWPIFNH